MDGSSVTRTPLLDLAFAFVAVDDEEAADEEDDTLVSASRGLARAAEDDEDAEKGGMESTSGTSE
jgi:hypothetical protein